jgi:hypothetical protein
MQSTVTAMKHQRKEVKVLYLLDNRRFNNSESFIINSLLAVPWLRWLVAGLSPQRPGLHLSQSMWDLWWIKLRWDRFSLSSSVPLSISFHRDSQFSYIILEMNNRPTTGCSSETWSNPNDINNSLYMTFNNFSRSVIKNRRIQVISSRQNKIQ